MLGTKGWVSPQSSTPRSRRGLRRWCRSKGRKQRQSPWESWCRFSASWWGCSSKHPAFFREDIIEDVLQCLPLKARGSAIAESLIDLRKGRDKFRAAEAVCQLKESDVIGGDGVVVVIDSGHPDFLSCLFPKEGFKIIIVTGLVE